MSHAQAPPDGNGTRRLLARVTCPHCWHRFAPEDVLWVASHGALDTDPRLGEAPRRFLPSRFTVDLRSMMQEANSLRLLVEW